MNKAVKIKPLFNRVLEEVFLVDPDQGDRCLECIISKFTATCDPISSAIVKGRQFRVDTCCMSRLPVSRACKLKTQGTATRNSAMHYLLPGFT